MERFVEFTEGDENTYIDTVTINPETVQLIRRSDYEGKRVTELTLTTGDVRYVNGDYDDVVAKLRGARQLNGEPSMIRLTYSNDGVTGQFHCPFCESMFTLPGNVHTYRNDGEQVERTHPDARNAIYSHFHFDKNAHIPECSAMGNVQSTTWEAVSKHTGTVVARGRVEVDEQKYVGVFQDEPAV